MLILVRHAPPLRRWHRRLGERLEATGHEVRYEAVGRPSGRRVLAIERRIYHLAPSFDAPEPAPADQAIGAPDLALALAGTVTSSGLVVAFAVDGEAGEQGLEKATRCGRAPHIAVRGGPPGASRLLASGRPAIEDPHVSARALEDLLPRLITLLVKAVARLAAGDADPAAVVESDDGAVSPGAILLRGLRHKIGRRLGPARGRPDHWGVALRRGREAAFTPLPDDVSRFRADPFLFAEAGRLWLFTEDFPYATGKGVIVCQPVDEGEAAASRVVLEEPFHLSYPLVLRHRGAIYMLPETCAAGCVRLYRADPFPDRWVPDAVLVADRRLADATPILHEGRWWLFATSIDDGGSSWDALHLFHAPDLFGPWTPHAANPVLIDAGAARPAGRMWHEDGVLMRPAQDCRTGYGVGIALCRVDRLDEGGYRQSVVERIGPPPGLDASGIHTLDREAGWEVVDLKVPHPRA